MISDRGKKEKTTHSSHYQSRPICQLNARNPILETFDEWTEQVDRGKENDVIYLDFRKAFDSVPND